MLQKRIDITQLQANPVFHMNHTILMNFKSYLKEALESHTIMLATVFHPRLNMDHFEYIFGGSSTKKVLAKELIKVSASKHKQKNNKIVYQFIQIQALVIL